MKARMQPVHRGVDARGEIVWGKVRMRKWQVAMISVAVELAARMCPKRYEGDFEAFWVKISNYMKTGRECENTPSMELSDGRGAYAEFRPKRPHHKGD